MKYRRKHQDDMWRREEEADKEEQEGERPYEEKVAEDNAKLTVRGKIAGKCENRMD